MCDDVVSVEVSDHIATVRFCRPPVNATDDDALSALGAAFAGLNDERDVRVAILTACGSRAFMAGADLRAVRTTPADRLPATRVTDPGAFAREAMWALYDCAVPVIAAVNGAAVGGGLAFAALCDIIVAAEHATFGTTEINAGLLGASSHLLRMVGPYRMRLLYLTGRKVSAAEMHAMGAVAEVVPAEEVLPCARGIAAELAAKSPVAVRLAKEALNRVEFLPLKEGYRLEQDYTNRLRGFEDAAEAGRAFLDKRDPVWRWR